MNVIAITTFDAQHIAAAQEIVAKANARAARAGIDTVLTTAHSVTKVTRSPRPHVTVEADVATFAVLGEPLKLAGWTFAATLTWDAEAGCITRPVPGIDIDLSAHRDAQWCDHCETRRQRNATYVVLHEDGRQAQVGSTCLAAYLGIDPTQALWLVDYVSDLSRNLDGATSGWVEGRTTVETLLGWAAAAAEVYGWTTRGQARDQGGLATVDIVLGALYPAPGRAGEYDRERAAAITAHLEASTTAQDRATATLAYIRSDAFTGTSEYVVNLRALLADHVTSVSDKNAPLAVSALGAYARHATRQAEVAARAKVTTVSVHQGALKERLRDLTLTVAAEPRYIDSQWGTSTLIIWNDADGNVFKWFASGTVEVAIGQVFKVTGTVKKHEVYNGTASTMLTRCVTDPHLGTDEER